MLSYVYRITNLKTGEYVDVNNTPTPELVGEQPIGIFLQQYPGFDLEVRSSDKAKSGQHGIWDFYSFYGKRTITMQGLIVQKSHQAVYLLQQKIRRILSLPAHPSASDTGYSRISWTDDNGDEWYVDGKIQQDVQFRRQLKSQNICDFFFSFKAENPYILSTTLNEQDNLMGWRQGSLFAPSNLPNNINIYLNNLVQFYQKGTSEGPAIFRLYGSAVNPKVTQFFEEPSETNVISDFSSEWVGGTEDSTHYISSTKGRKLTSVNGSADSMTLDLSSDTVRQDFNYSYNYEEEVTIHNFDSLTNNGTVTGAGDAQNLSVDTSVRQEGNASIKFDINPAASGLTYADVGVSDMPALDISTHHLELGGLGGYIKGYVYIPDVTKILNITIEIGSSGGANKSWVTTNYGATGPLVNGWNLLRVFYANFTNTGTGADFSAINYFHVKFNENGLGSTLTDFRVDRFYSVRRIKRQWVSFYVYIDNVDNMAIGDYTTGTNYIKFTNSTVGSFVIQFATANITLRNGWNYIRVLKDQCIPVVNTFTPSWEGITQVEIKIKSRPGTTLNATFDDLVVKNVTFSEKKMEFSYTIPSSTDYIEIDTAAGTATLNGSTDVTPYLTVDSEWFGTVAGENSFMYESDTNPLVTFVEPDQTFIIEWNDANL